MARATTEQLHTRIGLLADDVGRARRQLNAEPDSYAEYLLDRISGHIETLHLILEPSAGELAATTYPGDDQTVDAAIAVVDAAWTRLQARLRPKRVAA